MAGHPLDLSGRRILVTGASSGIGRATAVLVAELNATVIAAGRNAERLKTTLDALPGGGHCTSIFDLAAVDEIVPWVKRLVVEGGPLAGIVHSAGAMATVPIKALSARKFEEIMRVNTTSAAMLARGLRQVGCAAPGASIVLLSSVMGSVGQGCMTAYSAAKGAIEALTRSLAIELAPDGLRANCVAPGCVETEMLQQMCASLPESQYEAIVARHPLGLGRACDVAGAIAFLLAGTGRWITGTTLIVDGGYTAQ